MTGAARSGTGLRNPYGAFARALESGRLGAGGGGAAERRRRIPGLATESQMTVEEMAALGMEEERPRRRRKEL